MLVDRKRPKLCQVCGTEVDRPSAGKVAGLDEELTPVLCSVCFGDFRRCAEHNPLVQSRWSVDRLLDLLRQRRAQRSRGEDTAAS